ncbi:hypothetical protein MHK_010301 [Candidatus Magnetomorum sp. HK-1]|nr:hypothetical protein MHK_010301 [Candidatus Magnetomorum sp. HK-1]
MQIISHKDTINIILQNMSLQTNAFTDNHHLKTIVAEYLRYILNDLCMTNENSIAPVYQKSLTNQVYRHLKTFFSNHEKQKDRLIKVILWQLLMIRDIAKLSGGFLLPAPIRAIQMPCSDYVLIVGGMETKKLSEIIGATVKIAGFARYIHKKSINDNTLKQNNILWQDYYSYLGNNGISDLNDWIQQKKKQAKMRLEQVSVDSFQIDVYHPKQKVHMSQNKRWIGIEKLQEHNDEMMLCRRIEGKRFSFFWGKLSHKKPYPLIRETSIHFKDVRKLQYGIDHYYKCPTEIIVKQLKDYYQISLKNRLPQSYQRIIMALTQAVNEKNLYFSKDFKNDIVYLLEKLGIHVREI